MTSNDPRLDPPKTFLSLPREIRDEVYDLVFDLGKPLYLTDPQRDSQQKYWFPYEVLACHNTSLSLLSVQASNSLIANEARSALLGRRLVRICFTTVMSLDKGSRLLKNRIAHFDIRPFLRDVNILENTSSCPSDHEYRSCLEPLLQCPSLQTVNIWVESRCRRRHHLNLDLRLRLHASEKLNMHLGDGLTFTMPLVHSWCDDPHCDHMVPNRGIWEWKGSWTDMDRALETDMEWWMGPWFHWSHSMECYYENQVQNPPPGWIALPPPVRWPTLDVSSISTNTTSSKSISGWRQAVRRNISALRTKTKSLFTVTPRRRER